LLFFCLSFRPFGEKIFFYCEVCAFFGTSTVIGAILLKDSATLVTLYLLWFPQTYSVGVLLAF
jgi:hypothetical protein